MITKKVIIGALALFMAVPTFASATEVNVVVAPTIDIIIATIIGQ
ncbi:hypothetical protein [Mesorhizobium sp. 128a]